MISLIICSRNIDISIDLKQNIQSTIGVEYELVVIDNSRNEYSIFSAYNEGVRRAKYPYLCFMHEDILYHTKDWGKKIIDHLKNTKVGIIGVAGGHYLPNAPSAWFFSPYRTISILHNTIENGVKKIEHTLEHTFLKYDIADVVAVDGVWFCTSKILFNTITFDESIFKGFHCYDLDICLQTISKGYQVIVISDILLEHFSFGSINNDWILNSTICHKKWMDKLPIFAGIEMTENEMKLSEFYLTEKFEYIKEVNNLQIQIHNIIQSKAYKFGKLILSPLSALKTHIYKIN